MNNITGTVKFILSISSNCVLTVINASAAALMTVITGSDSYICKWLL